jgi:hypothetical protein
MHSAVPDNGWLDAGSAASPEMNALEWPALDRVSGTENGRVAREGSLKIIKKV